MPDQLDLLTQVLQELQALKRRVADLENAVPNPEIVPYEKVMTMLNCSRSTLDRMRSEGKLKAYRIKGLLYCKQSEILELIEQNPDR